MLELFPRLFLKKYGFNSIPNGISFNRLNKIHFGFTNYVSKVGCFLVYLLKIKYLIMRIKVISTVLMVLVGSSLFAQNLIKNNGFESGSSNYNLWTHASSAANYAITTEAHSGTKAALITVTKVDPAGQSYFDNIWKVQLSQPGFAVNAGDILKFEFWAKSDSIRPFQFGITKNSDDYIDYDLSDIVLNTEWTKYQMNFIAPLTTTDIRIIYKAGVQVGSYWLDDVSLTVGAQIDNSWYDKAEERIEAIRKGDFKLQIKDANGVPLTNCPVNIKLKKHEFKWGTAMSLKPTINADEKWYRETASSLFNAGVCENDFKWTDMEVQNGKVNYSNVQRYLDWAAENDWTFRGHTLVWGGKIMSGGQYWQTPSWLWSVSKDSAFKLIERRIKRDMTYFKGKFTDYDVVNEPLHETELADWLGDSINVLAYKWAKEADPNVRLYINDYSNIDGSSTSAYRQLIEKLRSKGAPVEGIGLQCHFYGKIDWPQVKMKMDYLAETGLPMKITEFDMNMNNLKLSQAEQAAEYAKMMRIAFSHPSVDEFLFWGFWDSRHWIPGAGLFDVNKNRKQAADSVYSLIHEKWTTDVTLNTDENGFVDFRGFYGKYEVLVNDCGHIVETSLVGFSKDDASKEIVLTAVAGIEENKLLSNSLSIFPNPAESSIIIKVNSAKREKAVLQITDSKGTVVYTTNTALNNGMNEIEVPVQGLSGGIYSIKITSSQQSSAGKFVKK